MQHEHQWSLVTQEVGGYVVAACVYDGCTTAKTVPYIDRGPKARFPMPQYMKDAGAFEGLEDNIVSTDTDKHALAAANRVMADLAAHGGGTYWEGTYLPFNPPAGFAVGIGGVKLPGKDATAEGLLWAMRIASKEFNTSFVGTWLDDGVVHIDAVEFYTDSARHDAIVRGIDCGQIAIYDFAKREAINISYTTEDHDR